MRVNPVLTSIHHSHYNFDNCGSTPIHHGIRFGQSVAEENTILGRRVKEDWTGLLPVKLLRAGDWRK